MITNVFTNYIYIELIYSKEVIINGGVLNY